MDCCRPDAIPHDCRIPAGFMVSRSHRRRGSGAARRRSPGDGHRALFLQLGILLLQRVAPLGFVEVLSGVLTLLPVEGRVRNAERLARLLAAAALIGVLQDPEPVLRGEALACHGPGAFRFGSRRTHRPVRKRRTMSRGRARWDGIDAGRSAHRTPTESAGPSSLSS